MHRQPYIGVTGFTSPQQSEAALRFLGSSHPRRLMIGVLASDKSLAGRPVRQPKRYPSADAIQQIFSFRKQALNLIHYHTPSRDSAALKEELEYLRARYRGKLDGFQLNIPWPDPSVLYHLTFAVPRLYLVLQVSRQAFEEAGNDPNEVAVMAYEYKRAVSAVLLDFSGGRGEPLDPELAEYCLEGIRVTGMSCHLGVAGGLGPNNLDRLSKLAARFPDLCIDAESGLRNQEDELDMAAVAEYISQAKELFAAPRLIA